MYEYKFERINIGLFGNEPKQDYHKIIENYAHQGWKLIQIFAPGTGTYGAASYFELIFERELK